MTIEFHCPHCEKLLKTADDKAGVRAKCPGCGEVVIVPTPQAETAGFDASFDESFGGMGLSSPPPIPVTAPPVPHPQADPNLEAMRPCPMCGESIRSAATRCRYCGEVLAGPREAEGVPTQIETGEILSRSWAIFQKDMGMCIAIVILGLILKFMAQLVPNIPGYLLQFGLINRDAIILVLLAQFTLTFMMMCFQGYISLGTAIAMLKIARGEQAQIGDLFAGGPYFLRSVGAGIAFWSIYVIGLFGFSALIPVLIAGRAGPVVWGIYIVGLFCCSVGGLFGMLRFDFYKYALVDRDAGAIESLTNSLRITRNNVTALLLIGLASIGLWIIGFVSCLLGLLIVLPYLSLLWAVTYLSMSGLPTAEQRRPVE